MKSIVQELKAVEKARSRLRAARERAQEPADVAVLAEEIKQLFADFSAATKSELEPFLEGLRGKSPWAQAHLLWSREATRNLLFAGAPVDSLIDPDECAFLGINRMLFRRRSITCGWSDQKCMRMIRKAYRLLGAKPLPKNTFIPAMLVEIGGGEVTE